MMGANVKDSNWYHSIFTKMHKEQCKITSNMSEMIESLSNQIHFNVRRENHKYKLV